MSATCPSWLGWVLLPAALVLPAGGCGGRSANPPPQTYSVTGQIVYHGKLLTGGEVEFQSTKEPRTARGIIQPDGTFRLRTFAGNDLVDGAVEGPHRVTVMPPLRGNQAGQPIHLPTTFTVKPGTDNHFTVTIPDQR
jgi:hypothetical protein